MNIRRSREDLRIKLQEFDYGSIIKTLVKAKNKLKKLFKSSSPPFWIHHLEFVKNNNNRASPWRGVRTADGRRGYTIDVAPFERREPETDGPRRSSHVQPVGKTRNVSSVASQLPPGQQQLSPFHVVHVRLEQFGVSFV